MNEPSPPAGVELITRGGRVRGLLLPGTALLAIATACCGGAWAGARFFYGSLESRLTAVEAHQLEADRQVADNVREIAVLKANAANTSARLDEVNRKLDTVITILLRKDTK